MITIEKLNSFGADTADGIKRCMNDENFYLRMVAMGLDGKYFNSLEKAIEAHDLQAAFEAAHTLKGVYGNLALTPLYNLVSDVVEDLRAKKEVDYFPRLEQIKGMLNELQNM